MSAKFDYFIVLAAMRTGSNLLEANLNAIDGIICHGEAFNPHFIGRLKSEDLLGVSLAERDTDPTQLINAIRSAPGCLNGFRYFQDHDPRVLEPALNDPKCGKIILTRNPLDSYLSLKIARETKQWQLKNIKRRLDAQVEFDPEEFAGYLDNLQRHQEFLLNHLQKSGQTAFYIGYDDLNQLNVLNGLAGWLGVEGRLDQLDDTLKPQNPAPPLSKVTNPDDMEQSLIGVDWFNLYRTPNFEPRRGPAAVLYVAATKTPLMYLPIRSGVEPVIRDWLAKLDETHPDDLITDRNRKQTRAWMQSQTGHRKFTVLRHPLARAHTAFCTRILNKGPGSYQVIRHTLRNRFKLPIPGQVRDNNYSLDQHYEAFAAFLTFLRHNLDSQTPIRVDGAWCSQSLVIEGMSGFAMPDLILREEELGTALPALARSMGHTNPPEPEVCPEDMPYKLEQIYDEQLEALSAEAYHRDYLQFGVGPWRPQS
ncbi:sulfotransferase family 2 domain-containing protein [uncultured Ruegeria sp.]|uniref:sulfotransferase family 2 domain-containing protein n=1 Tax=uncultured Ruegeria sp. TaxID=259304 RepID=UPI002607631B|nr:sulfotransferase family 2 domain-containing protein [uncultured Ruegeria sp.]